MGNRSEVKEFILMGFTDDPELQIPLFIMFTFIYLSTLIGNLGIVTLICLDSHLHTPMYFFLCNLSLVDFGYSSAITPKVMAGFLTGDKVISYNGCAAQFFFFVFFAGADSFLLACMAYDRHAAVCKPLHYTTTMTATRCVQLASGAFICAFLAISIITANIFRLSFCRCNIIHHFFCDLPPLLALSCSDIHMTELLIYIMTSIASFFSTLVIFTSYLLIFKTIFKMHSAEGRQKAFSTCASHFTTVSIFYGTAMFIYLKPSSNHLVDIDKMVSVFYTMVIPMLNPLVYSLRNKDVKTAFMKAVK